MRLLNRNIMSRWAYYQCLEGNDTQEMRDLITTSFCAYMYCKEIKDRNEMWNRINDSEWAYWYCLHIKDRPELRKYIISKSDLRTLEFKRNYKL